jgi:hypothetical protein
MWMVTFSKVVPESRANCAYSINPMPASWHHSVYFVPAYKNRSTINIYQKSKILKSKLYLYIWGCFFQFIFHPKTQKEKDNMWMVTFSKVVKRNFCPLFNFWGWQITSIVLEELQTFTLIFRNNEELLYNLLR